MKIVPKEIPYKDRSEFLRGFLILMKQNKNVSEYEREMAMVIGKYFGFDKEFCKDSINSILENEYISDEPPLFSDNKIAEYFVTESCNILKQLHRLTDKELNWLWKTADINKLKSIELE